MGGVYEQPGEGEMQIGISRCQRGFKKESVKYLIEEVYRSGMVVRC
ncbi:MAG: hypothetical protein V8R91_15250 [Butyricimonas faecihominis]